MAVTGQLERLFVHLGYYADRFNLTYVTWGDPDEEARLWKPFRDQTGAELRLASGGGSGRWRVPLRDQDVLRAMNLLATVPCLLAGRPFLVSLGADYAAIARIHGRPAWKWRLLQAVALRRAARVLVPNRQMATDLMVRYPGRPIVHHPNWVDCERFAPGAVLSASRRYRTVLFVGRLVKEKNLEALAEAVATLPETRLVCVGEGPLRDRLTALRAECVGPQPWTSLPHWYHGADVFALPSLSEGHPKALAEAMACGLPCVVSSAVTEGGEAVLRTDYLPTGLTMLLRDEFAHEYGQRARRHAVEHWDAKALIPKELEWVEAAAR
jgi:glycosyltransferase involved in cell wall biosynthesis